MNINFLSPVSITRSIMGKIRNILLIDDDEDCLFLTRQSLQKLHLFDRVDTSKNAYEAIKFITDNCGTPEKCPDVIFVDNQMPGMDGFGFLERLKNIPGIQKENFQIYMVSAYTNDADKQRLEKLDVQGFINKPLSIDKLKVLFN